MRRCHPAWKGLGAFVVVLLCSGPLLNCECEEDPFGKAQLEVNKTSLQFEAVAVGWPQQRFIEVSNLGGSGLTFSPEIQGGANSPFSVAGVRKIEPLEEEFTDLVPEFIGPSAKYELYIEYDPATEDADDNDILKLVTNDPDECPSDRNQCEILLHGTGAPPNAELEVVCQEEGNCPAPSESRWCWIVLDAATNTHPVRLVFDFCEVPQGQTLDRAALLNNIGNVPLSLEGFVPVLNIGQLEDFDILEPAAEDIEILPGESQLLTVRYQPGNSGVDNIVMHLATNDDDVTGNQFDVSCMAQSVEPDIDVHPENIPFQGVTQGSTDTKVITVHNTGDGTLVIEALEVTGGTVDGEFTINPTEGFDVLPSQQATISVTYAPQDAGQDDGAVTITSNDPDESVVTVTLGADVRPDLEVTPPDVVEFANVAPGGSAQQDVILRNVGYADLNITSVEYTVNPGDPQVFGTTNLPQLPAILAPAEALTFQITFNDNTLIEDELGQLEIGHDSPNDSNPYILLAVNSGTPANLPPVAVIEPPSQTVNGLVEISLNGSNSFDPDPAPDGIAAYAWSFLMRPRDLQGNESQAVLDSTDQPGTTFTPDMYGVYIVRLVVFDTHGTPSRATDAEVSVSQ